MRPRTSPITFITSVTLMSVRRLSTMANGTSSFLAKNRARSTPPASGLTTVRFGRFEIPEVAHQHRAGEQVIHGDIEEPLDLRGVQIDEQGAVGAGRAQQIRHQLCR